MVKLFVGLSILFTYTLMVMGNVVTTTGSGLECPDWPLCHGSVLPPFRLHVWFEWGHRLMGAATGFCILISALLAWFKTSGVTKWLILSALGLLGLGVIFGGIIVLMEAPLLLGPAHVAVISFHIILSTIIFALMIFAFRSLGQASGQEVGAFYPALFALIFTQVMLGILVRYGQASLACPDFPLCRGLFLPDLVDFKVTIHFVHRLVALTIFVTVTAYLVLAVRAGKGVANAVITFALVTTQGTLGAYIVWTGMFLPFIILHGATGFLLLGWVAYRSSPFFLKAVKPLQGAMA